MKIWTKSEDLEMDIADLLRLFDKDKEDGTSLYHEENFFTDICVTTFTIDNVHYCWLKHQNIYSKYIN